MALPATRAHFKTAAMLCLVICCGTASASSPFDGSWFFDAQQSSRPHVLQLSSAPGGVWTIFDGSLETRVVADGKLHREGSTANDERARQPDPRTLIIVSGVHGRVYSTQTLTLSSGGDP